MGAPELVRELVCGGRRGGGRGGIVEMVGEHGSPFPRPASQAVGFRQSNAVPSKEGLRRSWFWGSIRTARLLISPRLPGTPARPHSAGLCVSGASFLRLCGANHLRHLASVGGGENPRLDGASLLSGWDNVRRIGVDARVACASSLTMSAYR